MADAIPGHLKLKDQNARYNQYKYGYRVNHGNSEISKIKKMAAFWSWNIDFSCAFSLSGGKKRKKNKNRKKPSDFEIRDLCDKGTSGEDLLQISRQSVN